MFTIIGGSNFFTEFTIMQPFAQTRSGSAIINNIIAKLPSGVRIPEYRYTIYIIIIMGLVAPAQNSITDE